MEEPASSGGEAPKPQLPAAAAELPAALQSAAAHEEDAGAVGFDVRDADADADDGSSKAKIPRPPPRAAAIAPFDLDFDHEAAARTTATADRDDVLLDWRRYSNEGGQGFGDYGVGGVGSRALGLFLSGLAALGRRAGLRDDYESATFVAASLPPPPPAWWLRQTRARKRAILLLGASFLAAGTLALVALAGAVAVRSSSSSSLGDFLSSEEGAGVFGGGTWPATGAPSAPGGAGGFPKRWSLPGTGWRCRCPTSRQTRPGSRARSPSTSP